MKVKICGLTRVEDAQIAVEEGAWALGFVFYRQSPRYIAPEKVSQILASLAKIGRVPDKTVGVFVNSPPEEILATVALSGVNTIQLHGDESPASVQQLAESLKPQSSNISLIKAFRLKSIADLTNPLPYLPYVTSILCDAAHGSAYGGTGMIADWSLVSKLGLSKPLILAGGLNPENIIQAIHVAKPFAVDLSSGLESRPGCKDHDKIRYLFAAIRGSNAH